MKNLKAKDLRLGNWVYHSSGNIIDVEIINSEIEEDDLQPIPLTEEWLVKLGFEEGNYKELNEKHFVKNSNTIKVIISGVGFWDVYTDYNLCQITFSNGLNIITDNRGLKHVHKLQNLYFALTGEELILQGKL